VGRLVLLVVSVTALTFIAAIVVALAFLMYFVTTIRNEEPGEDVGLAIIDGDASIVDELDDTSSSFAAQR